MARREISAGCVVFRKEGQCAQVVLIQPRDRAAWSLPKGLIERGETPERGAIREVLEETGLSCEILGRIDTIKYSYIAKWENPPTRIFKVVTFYLSRFTGGDMGKHDHEVDQVEWFTIDDAIHRATYPQEREVLRKAASLIRNQSV